MRRALVAAAAVVAALAGSPAGADPAAVRMASMAPDGTAWARELKAYARDVEAATGGDMRIKLYLGGIAGDEAAVPDRIKKGQLDGEMAAVTCERMAPSLRVLRVPGLIRRRDEATYVIDRLRPTIEAEFRQKGLEVLLVNFREDPEVVRRVVRERGYTAPVLLDQSGEITGKVYGVWAPPTQYILDRQGRLVGRAIGPRNWDRPEARKFIQSLLDADAKP